MTDEVAELVLEDNRLQSLALSIAESGGARALPGHVRTIELLEAAGRLDRKVEGLASSEELLRRGQEGRGLTRPELAVVLSMSKLALQDAAEQLQPRRRQVARAAAVRGLPQADAQAPRRRHPRPPPAPRDPRHQGRQPLRQSARPEHRAST